jgi:hypothetical protein
MAQCKPGHGPGLFVIMTGEAPRYWMDCLCGLTTGVDTIGLCPSAAK